MSKVEAKKLTVGATTGFCLSSKGYEEVGFNENHKEMLTFSKKELVRKMEEIAAILKTGDVYKETMLKLESDISLYKLMWVLHQTNKVFINEENSSDKEGDKRSNIKEKETPTDESIKITKDDEKSNEDILFTDVHENIKNVEVFSVVAKYKGELYLEMKHVCEIIKDFRNGKSFISPRNFDKVRAAMNKYSELWHSVKDLLDEKSNPRTVYNKGRCTLPPASYFSGETDFEGKPINKSPPDEKSSDDPKTSSSSDSTYKMSKEGCPCCNEKISPDDWTDKKEVICERCGEVRGYRFTHGCITGAKSDDEHNDST